MVHRSDLKQQLIIRIFHPSVRKWNLSFVEKVSSPTAFSFCSNLQLGANFMSSTLLTNLNSILNQPSLCVQSRQYPRHYPWPVIASSDGTQLLEYHLKMVFLTCDPSDVAFFCLKATFVRKTIAPAFRFLPPPRSQC